MQTNDEGLLFQTSTDLKVSADRQKKLKAAENIGNPIRTSSKVLDFVIERDDAFVAESGWQIRQVDLKVCNLGAVRADRTDWNNQTTVQRASRPGDLSRTSAHEAWAQAVQRFLGQDYSGVGCEGEFPNAAKRSF